MQNKTDRTNGQLFSGRRPDGSSALAQQEQPETPSLVRKKTRRRWQFAGMTGGLILLLVLVASILPRALATGTTPASAQTSTVKDAAVQAGHYSSFGDGTFVVGRGVWPGTYRLRRAAPGCYFARLSGFGNSTDDVIASAYSTGPAVITIAATDRGFRSFHCGIWTRNLSRITASRTSFGAGTYIMGTDIEPGIYEDSGGHNGCTYERLSGFDGTTDDVVAFGTSGGTLALNIDATDAAFQSTDCGIWTKID